MRRFGDLALVAGLFVGFVCAQFTPPLPATSGGTSTLISQTLAAYTSYQPTNTWTIPTYTGTGGCSLGMGAAAATQTAGGYGGVYQDYWGGYWEVACDQYFSGTTYYDGSPFYEGTNTQGMIACFNGCAKRPGCSAFAFYGSQTSSSVAPTATSWTGGGRCV